MKTHYDTLGILHSASAEEVTAAYHKQQGSYRQGLDTMAPELRALAQERLDQIEQAYAVLNHPEARAEYTQALDDGLLHLEAQEQALTVLRTRGASSAAASAVAKKAPKNTLTSREIFTALGGALAGLLIIAVVWVVSGWNKEPDLPPLGEVNRPAPDFALPGLYGDEIRLSDYEGKVVLVNFWGTWCEPCKEETPALQEIHERLGDEGLVIIGIDLRNQERAGEAGIDDVRRFVEHYQVTYPIALDTDGAMARAFQIYPIPTSYFIDPNGTIRYVRPSTVTAEEVEIIFHKLKQTASALR